MGEAAIPFRDSFRLQDLSMHLAGCIGSNHVLTTLTRKHFGASNDDARGRTICLHSLVALRLF